MKSRLDLKFPSLSSLEGHKQRNTFKVNADVSSIIKVKEIKKNAARQIDGDVREKMRGRAKIRTNNSNSWKKGF